MRAITIPTFGDTDVLEVTELPDPAPGPGEIRVRVRAAAVNPTDIGLRSGRAAPMLEGIDPPYVPGMELAGTIDEVGEGSAWHVGDKVLAIALPTKAGRGAQSELVVVPDRSAVRIPNGVSFVEASTLPMNGMTVWVGFNMLGQKAGETLVVTGAAGAVGSYAVELGVERGLRVIAIASPGDEAMLKEMGAEHFVPRGPDAPATVRGLTGGVDAALDAALLNAEILPAIKDGGKLLSVRPFEGETERGIETLLVRVGGHAEEQEGLIELADLVAKGKLTLRVAEELPPERVGEAQARLDAGGVRGRLVVVF